MLEVADDEVLSSSYTPLPADASLDKLLDNGEETFQQCLFRLIDCVQQQIENKKQAIQNAKEARDRLLPKLNC